SFEVLDRRGLGSESRSMPPLLFPSVIHGHLSALRARRKGLFNLTLVFSSSAGVFDVRAVAQGVGLAEAERPEKEAPMSRHKSFKVGRPRSGASDRRTASCSDMI